MNTFPLITKDQAIDFSMEIENFVAVTGASYMDAIVHYCDTTGYEIETIAKLITAPLKAKIKMEAENLNFLPKQETIKLPFNNVKS